MMVFSDVSVKQTVNKISETSNEHVTFLSLKSRLIKLLICALENEVDSHNTQLLLGGIVMFLLLNDVKIKKLSAGICKTSSPSLFRDKFMQSPSLYQLAA